jgi:hypothetical protein
VTRGLAARRAREGEDEVMAKRVLIVGLVALIAFQGCSCWESKHTWGTAIGGATGAGLGALIGAMSGSWVWGGIIGLGAGALAGYLIADNFVDSGGHSCGHKAGYKSTFATGESTKTRDQAEEEFRLAIQAKDARTSEDHLRKSLSYHPTAPAWNDLGLLQIQDGRRRDAEDSFGRALALDPGYEPARKNLEKAKLSRV